MKEIENGMVIDAIWINKSNTITSDYFSDVMPDEDICECCECGETNYKEEAAVSEIWEDTWLCGSRNCNDKHYKGWSESLTLQKYYIKQKSIHRVNEHSFKGI